MTPLSFRLVFRRLRKNPATSILAVVALALGIGLSTGMFSIVYGVLFGPLPFADADRLMDLVSYDLDAGPLGYQSPQNTIHDFVDWREQQTSFAELSAATIGAVNLSDEAGYPERASSGLVTWNTFRTLGVRPFLGRDFEPADDEPGAPRVVLLGHDLWRTRFASDPKVVGRVVRLNGEVAEVIGVMPPDIEYPIFEDLWQPSRLDPDSVERGGGTELWVRGRLRDGVSRTAAQAEMSTIAGRLAETWPETNAGSGILVRTYRSSLNSSADYAILGVMFGAVGLVLLIACANVASLLLARASVQAREMAIRTALGAGRKRVIGLIVVESLVLSALGGVLGLGLAHFNTTALENAFVWRHLPFWIQFTLQPPAIVFAVLAATLAGLLSGLLPALKASGAVTFDLLKDEARGSSGLRIGRLTRVLVVGELALACALLVATGLMARSVVNFNRIDPGFATERILTAGLTLAPADYPETADVVAFYERLTEDLASLPQVASAAVMNGAPGTFMGSSHYAVEGEVYGNLADYPEVPRGVVSTEFFAVYDIPAVAGRLFTRHDDADSAPVAIVNESFAAKVWPGEDAVGQRLRLGRGENPEEPWREVVGVVPDAGVALFIPALAGTDEAGFYVPQAQAGFRVMDVAVATHGEPGAVADTLRERVRRLDAGLPLSDIKTMELILREQTFSMKVLSVCFSVLGGVALILAAVGIFGVTMFSVEQRTPEIGMRMAMGASPADVLGLVLRQGSGRLLVGLMLGLGLGYLLALGMRVVLYGVEPTDPLSFLSTVVVLAAVALSACWLPAWRAARVDPLVALRHD